MSELRLVPAAVVVWAVVLALLLGVHPGWVTVGLGVVAFGAVALRQAGQAILAGALGVLAGGITSLRRWQAHRWEPGQHLVGTVSSSPVEVDGGRYLIRLDVPGYPAELPVFVDELPPGVVTGALLAGELTLGESRRPGVGAHVARGEVTVIGSPEGMSAIAGRVRETFHAAVMNAVGESSQGLIPGMVLGDTSGQDAQERQLYIETGLSHLSAVSGANVAIVTTAAVLLCRALTLGPRVQVAAALVALAGFVGLVGTEPSVLRASVTGLVGLLAVLGSSRMEPIHGLSVAIIGLLMWNPDLAVTYGFALSVAATAGIVALFPLIYRPLARTRAPDILVRAVAVAVAADVVTMPIIALMAGEVSLVSVLANVLVAAVVPPVTIIGLMAVGLAQLPGGLEFPVLHLIEPLTWWIHTVAQWCAQLPNAIVPASPAWVLLGYGWVLAGVIAGHPLKTLAALMVVFGYFAQSPQLPPTVEWDHLEVHVVDTVEQIGTAPAGTQAIVVKDGEGKPATRPTVTREGIPVLFPHRDGPVSLHVDGSQHAADGRF
ncbi:ComEC/Rec2 family competence protein [Corynebacterium testudinoris]|uniref:ComEC/Rec2-related protein n=1 Tax=Corynebacterium testudinoris TaxID=136857 RepID=A0A0G3HE19_9CORY|nr:ComEC/Rec2 family competence protein [Corynebacterium testudinoris]AKK09392.1 ComEC/Rec2-related protein [Corynebacterium testudinoris]